jgi:oxygen-independent coproporphyrinogen-3 oxidase
MVQKQKPLENNCSLYVHIPFCLNKCDYCDFFSVPCRSAADGYVDAVIKEADYYRHEYGITAWKTVYIGGGTPSMLSPAELLRLLAALNPREKDCEVTVEINPDDCTSMLLDSLEQSGVARLSVGIQALDDKPLKAVHRRCSRTTIIKALELISKEWKGRLSCDIIAGLPCQTHDSFMEGLKELTAYPVEHVSLYTLTVEEETPLAKRISDGTVSWSSDCADSLWIEGRNFLEKKGFMQYEVSNFAKQGAESAHNLTYWNLRNYIGCGAGASGTIYGVRKETGGCTEGMRWTNTKDIARYCAFWNNGGKEILRDVEILDEATQEFEYIMMGFRTRKGISEAEFRCRFGKSAGQRIGADSGVFSSWKKKRLAESREEKNGDTYYALTKKGILLLNMFLEEI